LEIDDKVCILNSAKGDGGGWGKEKKGGEKAIGGPGGGRKNYGRIKKKKGVKYKKAVGKTTIGGNGTKRELQPIVSKQVGGEVGEKAGSNLRM